MKTAVLTLVLARLIAAAASKCTTNFCLNGSNCGHIKCAGCQFTCSGQCTVRDGKSCKAWCSPNHCSEPACALCIHCRPGLGKKCPLGTFKDVTSTMFSKDPTYWNQPNHSGMPYFHENPPVFVDLNGDNVPDYFNTLHGHKIPNDIEYLDNRMELALTMKSQSNDGMQYLDSISERIIFNDDPADYASSTNFIDAHGQNIVDLDGDGVLDIYIASGGYRGLPAENPSEFDNMLLFGEVSVDAKTGEEITIFRGGRTQARESGINARLGRGRFNYILGKKGQQSSDWIATWKFWAIFSLSELCSFYL